MNAFIPKLWFSLLHIDYVKLNSKWNYAGVISPYYRLYYIDDGEGSIYGINTHVKLEPGYLYLIPSFTLCHLECNLFLSQYFIQFFEESANGISIFHESREPIKIAASEHDLINFKRLLKINPSRGINRSDNPKMYEKNSFYKEYQELNKKQTLSSQLETQGIILQLLSRFLRPANLNRSEFSIPSTILDTVNYIQVNIQKQLTVRDLAKRANQHHDYFSRLFLKHIGERPIAFINEKRVERAQYLMTTTHMSLDQITAEVGFETASYFSRVFKKITKLTPAKYAAQARCVFRE